MNPPYLPLLVLACAYTLSGCASRTQAPVHANAPTQQPRHAPPTGERAVPAPGELVLVGRLRSYQAALGLSGSLQAVKWMQDQLVAESPILREFDWTLPCEFAVAYDPGFIRTKKPKPSTEASLTTLAQDDEKSEVDAPSALDHLLAAFSVPLRAYAPEVYRKLGYEPKSGGLYGKGNCVISTALGSAQARLICSDDPDVTTRMQGYMARGLPLETLSSSPIFVEIRPKPWKPYWSPARDFLKGGLRDLVASASPSAALAEQIGISVIDEASAWIDAVESLRLEAGPNSSGEFQATARVIMKSPEPWLVQSYLATAASVKEAPAPFLDLPSDLTSVGYQYGIPDERMAVLQNSLTTLARTALKEFGPASSAFGGIWKAPQAKSLDVIAETWVTLLNSPCIRTEYVAWASRGQRLASERKQPMPADVFLQGFLGQYLAATPAKAQCPTQIAKLMESFELGFRLLPKPLYKDALGVLSKPQLERYPGLPPITTYRFTISKQTLDAIQADMADSASNSAIRVGPATGSVTFTLMVAPNERSQGADLYAFGFNEKQMVESLKQAIHPTGKTLRQLTNLAELLRSNPIALSVDRFSNTGLLGALLGKDAELLKTVTDLFHDASVTTLVQASRQPGGSELALSYRLSPNVLESLRTLLGWDVARLEKLGQQLNKALESDKKPNDAE